MKRLLILIGVIAISATPMQAQTDKHSVEASDIEMIRNGENVTVNFTITAGKKATTANYNLVVNPIIRGGATQRQLPSIVIQGKRSNVADKRHELATGERRFQQKPLYMAPGNHLEYSATIPYEEWMRGGELAFEGVSVGCCSAAEADLGLIAANILYAEPEIETKIVEVPVVTQPASTGEIMAKKYPFVAPMTEWNRTKETDYDMHLEMAGQWAEQQAIEDTREGSISVYFRQGSRAVERNFADNNRNLVELISAVRAIATAKDTRIAKIVIAGFTSPEGSTTLNQRLAHDRAVAVKQFLVANSTVDPETIQIYNGGVDWVGLSELAQKSDLYNKQRIVEIIQYTPVWDAYRKIGRHGELMRLDGGTQYRYMTKEFFPKLRQAAYIRVYYENK
jgi:outer membrane protein OmpA-like peptidoglycan-associated protein